MIQDILDLMIHEKIADQKDRNYLLGNLQGSKTIKDFLEKILEIFDKFMETRQVPTSVTQYFEGYLKKLQANYNSDIKIIINSILNKEDLRRKKNIKQTSLSRIFHSLANQTNKNQYYHKVSSDSMEQLVMLYQTEHHMEQLGREYFLKFKKSNNHLNKLGNYTQTVSENIMMIYQNQNRILNKRKLQKQQKFQDMLATIMIRVYFCS